jgi:MFS family permease
LDPKYEITAAYSELNAYYPILSGLAVLLPQMAFGIPMGTVADKVNRVTLLGIGCVLWSSTTLISGEVDSFWVFVGARVFLGVFTASCQAPALSLIRDYFPPNKRSTVNSIYSASTYLGAGLSSLSVIFIKNYGWREDYDITGGIGILLGFILLFTV